MCKEKKNMLTADEVHEAIEKGDYVLYQEEKCNCVVCPELGYVLRDRCYRKNVLMINGETVADYIQRTEVNIYVDGITVGDLPYQLKGMDVNNENENSKHQAKLKKKEDIHEDYFVNRP